MSAETPQGRIFNLTADGVKFNVTTWGFKRIEFAFVDDDKHGDVALEAESFEALETMIEILTVDPDRERVLNVLRRSEDAWEEWLKVA